MDRNLALEFVRVTESSAIAAAKWVGRGDKHAADNAAVAEMRARFNQMDFAGRVVIGEGAKDQAPELYVGERVGKGKKPVIDLAVDPLEATDSVAFGRTNALSVIAAGSPGSLLSAPDTYMEKIAVGPGAADVIDLDAPVALNLKKIAKSLGKSITEIVVVMLDRPRHEQLLRAVRAAGARVRLITDGDVAAAVATCLPEASADVLLGVGGSTEAVLAAVAVKILGGEILCRFRPRNAADEKLVKKISPNFKKKIYSANDLAKGDQLTFTATGVIDGPLLAGVAFVGNKIKTHSLVMRASSGTVRYINTWHHIRH